MQNKSIKACAVATAFALGAGIIVPQVLGNKPASAEMNYEECYYVNNNQVSMTKSQYDSLFSMGFNDYEVANMTEEKFDKFVSIGFIPAQNEVALLSHITDSTKYRKFEVQDSKRLMEVYVSFTKVSRGYKIYVKQNVYWLSDPGYRGDDILSINYTNNIRVGFVGDYYDAEMHLRYQKWDLTSNGYVYHYIDNQYTGESTESYIHKLGESFSFKATLPVNTIYSHFIDFSLSMEVAFDTNKSTLTGTEIQSYYGHQIKGESVKDWGKFTFSTAKPFVSYSKDINLGDNLPIYDNGLYKGVNITFNDAWLSRC